MSETQTIEALVRRYCDAIHTQDETAFRALWSKESACTLISVGKVYAGLDDICERFLIGGIQKAYSEITLIPEDISVSFRGADLAVVIFRYHTECIRRADGSPFGIAGAETQVFLREAGEWKLTHLHYSKV